MEGSCPYCQEEQAIDYEHIQMFWHDKQEQQCKSCNNTFDWVVSLLGRGSVKTFKQNGGVMSKKIKKIK